MIELLQPLAHKLQNARDNDEKLQILEGYSPVKNFLNTPGDFAFLKELDSKYNFVIMAIVAIDQHPNLFNPNTLPLNYLPRLRTLLDSLIEIDRFYEPIGGIIGYHLAILHLIYEKETHTCPGSQNIAYRKPVETDISKESQIGHLIRKGIESLPQMAEFYPVGGAGDRLDLKEEITGEALPAAKLLFEGITLLERLVQDLQAREYLYYKLFRQQVIVPIALMTSHEKNNHRHIIEICEQLNWFGRPRDHFLIFIQPLVPVITIEGNWSLAEPLALTLKPGGHGLIWKLAADNDVFLELTHKGKKKALVRQINNPIAGIDYSLLAFAGLGFQQDKTFGIASCERLVNAAEGMGVLCEKKSENGYNYCISNVEYTEFAKKGIKDAPLEPSGHYSAFPANTNILFIDIKRIEEASKRDPFPGKTVNMKTKSSYIDEDGNFHEVEAGRLETMMQNVADGLTDHYPKAIHDSQQYDLQTFLTYNRRLKTISVTKNSHHHGRSLNETPEGCFYDLLENYADLFENYCHIQVPPLPEKKDYLEKNPSFLAWLHPALGPLFSIIAQKIQKGIFHPCAEIVLKIAELMVDGINLQGSLQIIAKDVVGKMNSDGILSYGEQTGKCLLKNVVIENSGVNYAAHNIFWKHSIERHESCQIILHGNGEFVAENVRFKSNLLIEVPDGYRVTAYHQGDSLHFRKEKISSPSWHWSYAFDGKNQIILNYSSLCSP